MVTSNINKQHIISEWVHLYSDSLYAWAKRKVGDEESSRDLVQDTFLTACKNFETFRHDSSPKTWLIAILKNKVVDHFREQTRTMRIANPEDSEWFDESGRWRANKQPHPWMIDEENLLDNPEFRSIFYHCLSSLPNVLGACIRFKYLTEKNTEDICQELDITSSNFWQIIHRARLRLRHCLQVNWFDK